jgi:hypothetical protein
MDIGKAIQKAIDLIGENQKDDYRISPTEHSAEFGVKYPGIKTVLSSATVKVAAERYKAEDTEACDAQKAFNLIFNRANISVLLTSMFITLILAGGILLPGPSNMKDWILIGLSILSILIGGVATKDLFILRQGKLLESWMLKRTSAEKSRLDYFESIVNATITDNEMNGIHPGLVKLEYFRRFQLDVQRAYYRKRGADHRKSSLRTLSWSGWAAAGLAVVGGLTGILVSQDSLFSAIAALGIFFTGFSNYAMTKGSIYQDQRIADTYEKTARVLDGLYTRIDDVRKAVFLGGDKPLASYVKAVHAELSTEQKQWNEGIVKGSEAFVQLDDTLKDTLAKIQPKTAEIKKT